MSRHHDLERMPLRAIPATYVRSAPSIAGLLGVGAAFALGTQLWPGPIVLVLVGVLLAVRLVHPLVTWATLRFAIESDGVRVESGLWVRRRSTADWGRIRVRQQEQPWAYRLFGLAELTLHMGGEATDGGSVVLPGIDVEVARALVELGEASFEREAAAASETPAPAPPPASSPLDDAVLYRATGRDLLVSGVVQGRVLVAGIAALFAVVGTLDEVGLGELTRGVDLGDPRMLALLLVGVVALGMAATLIRFHAFEVRRGDGGIALAHGLLDRQERVVRADGIVGFRLHRNVAEMALDRVRVVLLTQDSTGRRAANLMLPSLPRRVVSEVMTAVGGELPPAPMLDRPGRGQPVRALAVAASVIVLGALAALVVDVALGLPLALLISLAVVTSVGIGAAYAMFRVRWRLDDTSVCATRHHLFERQDVVRLTAIHQLTTFTLGRTRRGVVSIRYFAGTSRAVRAVTADTAATARLGRAIGAAARGTAQPRPERRRVDR